MLNLTIDTIPDRHTHDLWHDMVHNCSISDQEAGSFTTINTSLDTECSISPAQAEQEVAQYPDHVHPSAPQPDSVEAWSYIQTSKAPHTHHCSTIPIIVLIWSFIWCL